MHHDDAPPYARQAPLLEQPAARSLPLGCDLLGALPWVLPSTPLGLPLGLDHLGVVLAVLALLRRHRMRMAQKLLRHSLLAASEHQQQVVHDVLLDGTLAGDEGGGDAFLSRAARAPDAVRVRLDVLGHIVVDHVLYTLHVDAASRDVRGDKDLELARLEALNGLFSRRLVLAGVDHRRWEAHLVERLAEHVTALLVVTEDHDRRRRPVLQQLKQLVLLLVLLDEDNVLRDVVLGRGLVTNVYVGGLAQVLARDALDGGRHRR
mmetsp:Transcript_20610/g.47534  ORF Transcript_20610/g.47534 Transcript_20610/m.47534 type:complete len:263 (-) Transcript_20610:1001-1789(-)